MKMQKSSLLLAFSCLIFSVITSATASMFNNSFQLSSENQLSNNFSPNINAFWEKHAQSNRFLGVDDTEIYTISITTGNNKAIVISQGRNESVLKYKEVAFDLNQQGYDLFLIDHRGQGFSDRLGGDKHRGHVQQFQDYVDDLNTYVAALDLQKKYRHSYLLSHSMGGTISALYLEQYPHPFQAAIFFSPMFSINLGGIPAAVAKIITASGANICSWFSDNPCYIFSGKSYESKNFKNNALSSSEVRFYSAQNTFEQHPETQLGSVTMRWIAESISATEQAVENANRITIPLLVIQAGADTVVTSTGQKKFFDNSTFGKEKWFLNIAGAQHEILLESDQYRVPALNAALRFLSRSQQGKLTLKRPNSP